MGGARIREIAGFSRIFIILRDAWGAQSVERPTLGFGSGHNLTVHGIEPRVGLWAESVEPAWDSLSPSFSASFPPPPQINKYTLKKTERIFIFLRMHGAQSLPIPLSRLPSLTEADTPCPPKAFPNPSVLEEQLRSLHPATRNTRLLSHLTYSFASLSPRSPPQGELFRSASCDTNSCNTRTHVLRIP